MSTVTDPESYNDNESINPQVSWEQVYQQVTEGTLPIDPSILLPEFTEKSPREINTMRVMGIHPETRGFVNPYNGEVVNEYFGNIGNHCLAVAFVAGSLADELRMRTADSISSENSDLFAAALNSNYSKIAAILCFSSDTQTAQPVLNGAQIEGIIRSGLLHDANKPPEVLRKTQGYDSYTPESYEKYLRILESQGVAAEDVEKIRIAESFTGHNSLTMFVRMGPDGSIIFRDMAWEPMLIHLADDVVATDLNGLTRFLTPALRMFVSRFPEKYPWMWKAGFGFDSNGEPVQVEDINNIPEGVYGTRHFAAWQIFVSGTICQKYKDIVDPKNILPADWYVQTLLNNSWRNYVSSGAGSKP